MCVAAAVLLTGTIAYYASCKRQQCNSGPVCAVDVALRCGVCAVAPLRTFSGAAEWHVTQELVQL
jgi:hypothetical protein